MLFLLVFFAGLITLSVGVAMLTWSYRREGKCVCFARVFGYIVVVGAVVGLLGAIHCGVMYHKHAKFGGEFKHHPAVMQSAPVSSHEQ